VRFCLWHDQGYHYHRDQYGTGATAMKTHRVARWVVGAVALAAIAFSAFGSGSHRTMSDVEWTAPAGQIVAR
jgi:hypothetical protein